MLREAPPQLMLASFRRRHLGVLSLRSAMPVETLVLVRDCGYFFQALFVGRPDDL